jgi:hypothetical protein
MTREITRREFRNNSGEIMRESTGNGSATTLTLT